MQRVSVGYTGLGIKPLFAPMNDLILGIKKSHHENKFKYRGDTIVEVLMAIAIAAFAIGTCYAIANRSLQHAISARERNEAVNLMEDQIANLKVRYKASP